MRVRASNFKVDSKEYKIAHDIFRNKFLNMSKAGEMEIDYYSSQAYYTWKASHMTMSVVLHNRHWAKIPSSL